MAQGRGVSRTEFGFVILLWARRRTASECGWPLSCIPFSRKWSRATYWQRAKQNKNTGNKSN